MKSYLYAKFLNKANEKLLVVETFGTIDYEHKTEVPNSVKLLNVNEGTTTMVPHSDFIQGTLDGRLRQVNFF